MWDGQHGPTHQYMQLNGVRRHTSERVYKECRGVFGLFRRAITRYLSYLVHHLPASPDPFALDQILQRLTRQYANSLRHEKEKKVVSSFMNQNMVDLRNCLLGTEHDRCTFKHDIIDAIKGAIESLDFDCRPDDLSAPIPCYTCCPKDYDSSLPGQKRVLSAVIGYEPDVLVILDSYFIQIHCIEEAVGLVTTDKTHILRNRETIEETLPGLLIREPESFFFRSGG